MHIKQSIFSRTDCNSKHHHDVHSMQQFVPTTNHKAQLIELMHFNMAYSYIYGTLSVNTIALHAIHTVLYRMNKRSTTHCLRTLQTNFTTQNIQFKKLQSASCTTLHRLASNTFFTHFIIKHCVLHDHTLQHAAQAQATQRMEYARNCSRLLTVWPARTVAGCIMPTAQRPVEMAKIRHQGFSASTQQMQSQITSTCTCAATVQQRLPALW